MRNVHQNEIIHGKGYDAERVRGRVFPDDYRDRGAPAGVSRAAPRTLLIRD